MLHAGNLCIVDYRYFLSAGQTGADARSLGKVTIHELGHSLGKSCSQEQVSVRFDAYPAGLLHPHAGVDFTSNSLPNPVCLSGGARTRGCRVPANDVVSWSIGTIDADSGDSLRCFQGGWLLRNL
jgi:hypothetical protein